MDLLQKTFDETVNELLESSETEEEIEKIFEDEDLLNKALATGKDIGFSKRIDDVIGRYIVSIKSSFPKDLSLEIENLGDQLVVSFKNRGDTKKLISTVDEVLEHIQLALKVIE